jgi:hypothetical protein
MSHGSGWNSGLTMIKFDSNSNFLIRFGTKFDYIHFSLYIIIIIIVEINAAARAILRRMEKTLAMD